MTKFPTTGENNDFLLGAPTEKVVTARDVLTYLYAESKSWTEDVDGDADDEGRQIVHVNHDICISDRLLEELLDMAGINKARYDETALERLARANEEDCNTGIVEAAQAHGRIG